MPELLIPALVAALVCLVLTPLVIKLACSLGIVDRPGGRRIHGSATPRLGGLAVMASFFAVFWLEYAQIDPHFKPKQLAGFMVTCAILLLVGVLDDKFSLPASIQLASHVVVALTLVVVGMGIEQITNPVGGKIDLNLWQYGIPVGGVDHFLTLPADLLTVLWVVLVINSLNWLDGLDGLATGVGMISAIAIALLSLSAVVSQPHVALLAMIFAGALAGFLVFNFQPAKIFLGTVGSTFIGFMIATLAIISGGKIATALLVLGVPVLDAIVVIFRRFRRGGRAWTPGTDHLHHLFLAKGFGVRRTVVTIYLLTATFGALALLAGTTGRKALAFILLLGVMGIVLVWLARTPDVPKHKAGKP